MAGVQIQIKKKNPVTEWTKLLVFFVLPWVVMANFDSLPTFWQGFSGAIVGLGFVTFVITAFLIVKGES